MANKRPKPEEIVTKLRQVEVLTGQGMPRLDAIRQIGVTEQTFYRWKKKYGGMGTDQLKELKRLQKENDRLRKAVSDLTSDKQFLETPWYGSLQMARYMKRQGHQCGRHRLRRLMRKMRLVPIYQAPNTSRKHPQHKVWPYLLRNMAIDGPNQVWCADITYVPMRRGFLYLVAIMDWHSRKVLSWRLLNSMEADFCVEALKEALDQYGAPEIMNTDQGSQFTGFEWTNTLTEAKVSISMDGRGRWIDNRMIERLGRSLKYECVYINAFETGSGARSGIGKWMTY